METAIKKLVTISLHNLGFFGGRREGVLTIDGQYVVVTDHDKFVIYQFGGYGNLTSFPKVENPEIAKLTEADYRYVHDALLEQLGRTRYEGEPNEVEAGMFNSAEVKHQIHKHRISANIGYGDKVKDLRTGEVIVVNHNYDVQYINRNFNYKLVDRELHPEPMTLDDFIKINEAKNPFEGWDVVDAAPKNKNCIYATYTINGENFDVTKDYSGNGVYYIKTPAGVIYKKSSSISAPFHDAIDILVGQIKSEIDYSDHRRYEYVYKDVTHKYHGSDVLLPNNYRKVTEAASYNYNTRATYL